MFYYATVSIYRITVLPRPSVRICLPIPAPNTKLQWCKKIILLKHDLQIRLRLNYFELCDINTKKRTFN